MTRRSDCTVENSIHCPKECWQLVRSILVIELEPGPIVQNRVTMAKINIGVYA